MRHITSTLIESFADLQRKGIVHLNIKPANIVALDSNNTNLKVCNFELAKEIATQGNSELIEL